MNKRTAYLMFNEDPALESLESDERGCREVSEKDRYFASLRMTTSY